MSKNKCRRGNVVVSRKLAIEDEVTARKAQALQALDGKARFVGLVEGANAVGAVAEGVGAWNGQGAVDALFVLAGDDPAVPTDLPEARFLVVQSAYRSPLTERADVVLPSPTWFERQGHLTNLEGRVRAVDAICAAPEGVPAEWHPLATLKERLGGQLKG